MAEFGVSVSRSARGLGVGTKLFERARHPLPQQRRRYAVHALPVVQRHHDAHCEEGRHGHPRDYGEADAYLKLPLANPGSVLQEALDEQFATLDYTLKANKRFAAKWFNRLAGRK